MEQDVALPELGEQSLINHFGQRRPWRKRLKTQLGMIDGLSQRQQPREVHWPVDAIHLVGLQLEMFAQQFSDGVAAIGVNFQPHRAPKRSATQLARQRMAQVGHLLFIDPQITVARHAELRIADHFSAGKQRGELGFNQRGQQNK